MKRVTILGSTGSIGRSTLDVIQQNREQFRVVALTAGRNIDLFEKQIDDFKPEIAAVADRKTAALLRRRVKGVEILAGVEGVSSVASYGGTDFVVSSIVGSAGLVPTLNAIAAGKTVGLANKESLVMAGELVMREARKNGVKIIPVDSEHCAVFQCLAGYRKKEIRRVILTASGGPFFNRRREELGNISAKDALRHPNWSMGKKISIDSATLMNKGFEVIEACWLFGIPPEKVDVLIHPQSIVHSMVEFTDRTCLAQMSVPDMRGPIAYALSYPKRLNDPIRGLELDRIESLTFRKPDTQNFPCLSYAYEAMAAGGTAPAVLNAANEAAVNAFLDDSIRFNDISVVIRSTVDAHTPQRIGGLEDVLAADLWARKTAEKHIRRMKR